MANFWGPVCLFLVASAGMSSSELSLSSVKKYFANIFAPGQIRVIGGSNAVRGQFPYQVLMRVMNKGKQFFCGGSVISDSHVLTAAHCVENVSFLLLTFGSVTTSPLDGTESRFVTKNDVVAHPDYDPVDVKNDIALIFLNRPVQLSVYVSPVQLPTSNYVENVDGYLTGWGRTSDSSKKAAKVLQYAKMELLPLYKCMYYWNSLGIPVDSSQICTKYVGTASCNGDSGGPLVVMEQNGAYTQVGIVSFGVTLCESGSPSVYTRVGAYLKWINLMTGIK
ncbi:chymotrypsin-2-like [Cimex lectularius]|uniref:Peptidase S1 domain-containing protein n=1 Tax=Cimex lectularius TaxID=79782 RepID=A0A8I6SBK4_CIMLE|nr:chymotrypsin-2-like [Cimex lectularius]